MRNVSHAAPVLIFLAGFCLPAYSQQATTSPHPGPEASPGARGVKLAKAGHCKEALPLLKGPLKSAGSDLKREAGLAGVRCAMAIGEPDAAIDFLRVLRRDFPHDPEVLFVVVHAFSDLSSNAAQELARTAPNSYPALELNAESLEMQGKWDQAAQEYQKALAQDPNAPGIHFRLGRLLLSKPNPPADVVEQARKEFQAELRLDPANAGAEYVLGELARQDQNWADAIPHFSRASKLDPLFGDAFLGLGEALLADHKFSEAIPPLESATKLQPANPATHYNLATAYSRAGRKAEADKEFAIHRQMTQKGDAAQESQGNPSQSPN